MNAKINGKPLSDYLQGLVDAQLVDSEVARQANRLPTVELQEEALERFRAERAQLAERIVADLLSQASGKILNQALPKKDESLSRWLPFILLALFAAGVMKGFEWGPFAPSLPAPEITKAYYAADNKLALVWRGIGMDCKYRIYRSDGDRKPTIPVMKGKTFYPTSALITLDADKETTTYLAVRAVDFNGHEGKLSKWVRFTLKPGHRSENVEAIHSWPIQ